VRTSSQTNVGYIRNYVRSLDNMVDKAKLTEYMEKSNSLETKVCFMDRD
jgi:hypothetical protein